MKHLVRKYSLLSLIKILIVYAWIITYIIIIKKHIIGRKKMTSIFTIFLNDYVKYICQNHLKLSIGDFKKKKKT
jgi:hypothetical protein